ncbi:MAG: TPR end-of-group domain-containing protein [Gaiellaceae bacterium]
MKTLHLDEVEGIPVLGTLVWKPVRKMLGVTAFGINAYTAANAGDEVVEDHTEAQLGHEEIYAVVAGHATFTVDGEEVDAPAGTLVYLDDPAQRRSAVAKVPNTTVLAIGGVPGVHEPSVWEYTMPALPYVEAGDYEEAKRIIREAFDAKPEHPAVYYHLARVEAIAGEREEALEHLNTAVRIAERFRPWAQTDEGFDAIRDDPRFPG